MRRKTYEEMEQRLAKERIEMERHIAAEIERRMAADRSETG
jgi:hypothetical protein